MPSNEYPKLALWLATMSEYNSGVLTIFILAVAVGLFLLIFYRDFVRWSYQYPLRLIMAIAFLLRLPGLFESLWYDEAFSAAYASVQLDQLPTLILSDVHPPLWYLVEWLNTRIFGNSEFALRLPALLFGLFSIWLTYRIAQRIEPKIAVVVALLVAVLPTHIYYSGEARGYTLLLCANLIMVLSIIKNQPRMFAAAAVTACYTHNIGFAYAGMLGLYALWHYRSSWLQPLLIAGGMCALWLPAMLTQSRDIADGFWLTAIEPGNVVATLYTSTIGASVYPDVVVPSLLVIFVISLAAIWHYKFIPVWWVAVLGVPTAVLLVSIGWQNVFLDRALLCSYTLLLIGWSAAAWQYSIARYALVAVVAVALLAHFDPERGRVNVRDLLQNCGKRPVFATAIPSGILSRYYLENVSIWADANDLNQTLSEEAKHILWQNRIDLPPGNVCVVDMNNALNRSSERDWLAAQLAQYPHETVNLASNSVYTFQIHLVEVPR